MMALFCQAGVRRLRSQLRIISLAAIVALIAAIAVAQEPEPSADDAEKTPTTYFDLRTSKDLLSRQIADRYFNLVKLQEWSSDKGTKINAKYVSHSDDLTSVTLAVARGSGAARVTKEVTVPTIRLSKTCQSRVKQIATLQKRLDDLLAKAAEEPADPNSPEQIAADRGRPMGDDRGVQPPPRRVRQRPGAPVTPQPAATPPPPLAAPPSSPAESPSADDGSEDPLGFGELPAAPAGAFPQPPIPGDPNVPPGLIPPTAAPPAEGGAATPPNDADAWRTNYNAFRANIRVETGPNARIDWGPMQAFKEVADEIGKYESVGDEERRRILEKFDAIGEFSWETTLVEGDVSQGDWTQRLNMPPLPEPLSIGFVLDEENPGNWQNLKTGDRVRFTGRFSVSDEGDFIARIRFPEKQPAPPSDPAAWRTDYEAFRASIQVDSTLSVPQAKFGAIKELQAALDLVQKQDADGDVGEEELAERAKLFDAVGEFTWEGTMSDVDPSSDDWTQRLNLQPLPEPLGLGLFVAEENPGNWQRFRVGDRVRFVGRFVNYDPAVGDLEAEIRFPDEQPAPPVRNR